ncbi:hypothetical protein NCS56_00356600 [Fusarium sp. Ph1]|nr:hypothetical protein NCS56_00356600 [Fusarium sp. Ph1]
MHQRIQSTCMQPSRRPAEASDRRWKAANSGARVCVWCIISDGVHEPFSDARYLGGVGVPWGSTSYVWGMGGEEKVRCVYGIRT